VQAALTDEPAAGSDEILLAGELILDADDLGSILSLCDQGTSFRDSGQISVSVNSCSLRRSHIDLRTSVEAHEVTCSTAVSICEATNET